MRVSYPALRASKVDPGLKKLFLAELMTQALNEGMEVIVPEEQQRGWYHAKHSSNTRRPSQGLRRTTYTK
jgi:hypothetical protein